jgi:hypothetical protein
MRSTLACGKRSLTIISIFCVPALNPLIYREPHAGQVFGISGGFFYVGLELIRQSKAFTAALV